MAAIPEGMRFLAATKLGALGGSFNPIHSGHLHVARRIRHLFRLTQVHFVVASSPPHKPAYDLAPLIHRYAMVCLALAGSRTLLPSLTELEPPPSPFSIHTLRKLDRDVASGEGAIYFIAGGDSLREVGTWHQSEELLSAFNFIFVARPGAAVGDPAQFLPPAVMGRVIDLRNRASGFVRNSIRRCGAENRLRIYLVDVGAPDISASTIRRRVAGRKSIDGLVPASVRDYINKLHLYGDR